MSTVVASVITFADGFGRWRARVNFAHTLSESDSREQYNLSQHWPAIRRRARTALVEELVEREQKTHQSAESTRKLIRALLPPLVVVEQHLDAANRWHGVTLGEP